MDDWKEDRESCAYELGGGGETGEEGSEPPEDLVVTVSFLLRLMERMEWDSARSRERKELPASRRRGAKVRKIPSSSEVGVS